METIEIVLYSTLSFSPENTSKKMEDSNPRILSLYKVHSVLPLEGKFK